MKKINTQLILKLVNIILLPISVFGIIICIATDNMVWVIPFLTIPLISITILPLTFQKGRIDATEPIIMILVSLLIGTVLRSFFIVSPAQSAAKQYMLLGKSPFFLLKGLVYIYVGMICFILGYSQKVSPGSFGKRKIYRREMSLKKFRIIAAFVIVLSVISGAIYFKKMGINLSSLAGLSQKRFYKLDNGAGYAALGYERVGMELSKPLFFLLFVYFLKNNLKLFSPTGMLLIFLGGLNVIFPFIESSRSTVAEVFIYCCIIYYYIKGNIKWKAILPVLGVAMGGLILMTALRSKVEDPNQAETNVFTIVVGSLNFFGIDKTSQIIDGVPEKMNYMMGESLLLWTVAPVPRTLWPEKPEISIGLVIADKIYQKRDEDNAAGGVPPGFIAELYLNFGPVGVIVGMFLFGLTLKALYVKLKPLRRTSTYGLLLFVLMLVPVSLYLIGGDLSRMVIETLTTMIPIYIILKLSQVKDARR